MKHQTIQFQGKTINFKIQGEGETVVLLHGFLESLSIWNTFSQELARDFQVFSIDLPGHGQSDTISSIHSMELMAEVVHEVLILNRVDRCAIIGHSMGGYVTLEFAARYPEMTAAISLFHSGALPDTDEAKTNRDRTIEIVKKNHQHFISQFIPELFAPSNRERISLEIEQLKEIASKTTSDGIIAALSGMKMRKSHLHTLLSMKCPVLFIGGKQDPRIPVDKLLSQAMLPMHAEVLLIEGCGHMGYLENEETTLKAIKHFAERILY